MNTLNNDCLYIILKKSCRSTRFALGLVDKNLYNIYQHKKSKNERDKILFLSVSRACFLYGKSHNIIPTDGNLIGHLVIVGDLLSLIELYESGATWNGRVKDGLWIMFARKAAELGHIHILEWLKGLGCNIRWPTAYILGTRGEMSEIKWLLTQNSPEYCIMITDIMMGAVGGGHIKIFIWLKEYWLNLDKGSLTSFLKECFQRKMGNMCGYAARHGQLEMLKWLREQDYPWDEDVPIGAIKYGHIDTFSWAIDNGCPYNRERCMEMVDKLNVHKCNNCRTYRRHRRYNKKVMEIRKCVERYII